MRWRKQVGQASRSGGRSRPRPSAHTRSNGPWGSPAAGKHYQEFDRAYGHLSEFAHNRRHRILQTVSTEQRTMPMGPHPDVRHRAAMLREAESVLFGAVTTVGHALAVLLGPDWFTERFNPTFHALHALAMTVPLPTPDAD